VNKDVPLAKSRANTDIAKAEASYLQSMSTVERNKRLAEEDAIPRSELEMSISQMKATKAEFDAAKIAGRQIDQQMSSQTALSPTSGSVIVLYQNVGDFVGKGTPIAMVADFSKMYFNVLVEDEKIRNIAPLSGKFSLRTDLTNMTEKAFTSAASSSFSEDTAFNVEISSVLPPLSESVPVRSVTFEVDNSLGVMELGMYTDIIIRKETPKSALSIPSDAIFDRNGTKVYVQDEDSRLALRDIRTGIYDAEYVEVTEGLKEGDVVITSGVEGLDIGIRVEVNAEENLS
jgi:RND family efflux transporter MFP subunit